MEARPIQAPTHLAWYQINASTVDILWKAIPEQSFKGTPLGYQVKNILIDVQIQTVSIEFLNICSRVFILKNK